MLGPWTRDRDYDMLEIGIPLSPVMGSELLTLVWVWTITKKG
jgi:hypothetical protein